MKRNLLILLIFILFSSFNIKETAWLAVGDSITYLNDHLNETGNRVTKGYLTRVTEHVSGLKYVNKGINGITAVQYAQNIEKADFPKADICTVFLGTNDWWAGNPLGVPNDYKSKTGGASFYGAYRIIIDHLRSLNPAGKLVLITPMQRADFVYIADSKNNAFGSYQPKNGQELEAFANAVDSIAKFENVPVIDLYHNKSLPVNKMVHFKRLKDPATGGYTDFKYPDFISLPFNPDKDEYPYPPNAINLTYDGLHPSDKGCKILAKCLVKEFKLLLK